MTNIDQTLAERGNLYGQFKDHAMICQGLKAIARGEVEWIATLQATAYRAKCWNKLADDQKQALEAIFDKIARILNGDPNYIDNWHDIQGYAKLVEDRLLKEHGI